MQELRRWQQDARSAKDDKFRAEETLKSSQEELETMRDLKNKYQQLQDLYSTLSHKVASHCPTHISNSILCLLGCVSNRIIQVMIVIDI